MPAAVATAEFRAIAWPTSTRNSRIQQWEPIYRLAKAPPLLRYFKMQMRDETERQEFAPTLAQKGKGSQEVAQMHMHISSIDDSVAAQSGIEDRGSGTIAANTFRIVWGRGKRHRPLRETTIIVSLFWAALISTSASAQTCTPPPADMIAWWTLDETSGIVAKDSVGNEPAAYLGSPTPTPGLVSKALDFNGSTDFLSAPQNSEWDFGLNNFTIELWANFAAVPGGTVGEPSAIFIGADEGPTDRNKWFFATGGGMLYFHINSPTLGPQFISEVPFSPTVGKWYHLSVVRSGSIYTIYINGVASGSATNSNAVPSPNAPLTIASAESIGYMNGILDEISVYNRALSGSELQAIVNAGSAGKCKLPTATAISPSSGGNAGTVTTTLSGSSFTSATTVSLQMAGQPSIAGSAAIVSPDGTLLTTTFDLTGQAVGARDVVVNTPTIGTTTLPHAFQVVPPAAPDLWVDVVGSGVMRSQTATEFQILYGNYGNNDVIDAPVLVVFPADTTATIGDPGFTGTFDPSTIGPGYTAPVAAFLVSSSAPASSTQAIPITFTVPASASALAVTVRILNNGGGGFSHIVAGSGYNLTWVVFYLPNWINQTTTRHSAMVVPILDPQGNVTQYGLYMQSTNASGMDYLSAYTGSLDQVNKEVNNEAASLGGAHIFSGSVTIQQASDINSLDSTLANLSNPADPFQWKHSEECPVCFNLDPPVGPLGNCDGILLWATALAWPASGNAQYAGGIVPISQYSDEKWADPTTAIAKLFGIY